MRVNPEPSNYELNKAAYKAKAKEWKKNNPEKVRLSNKKTWLKATYGLSWEEFQSMYEMQRGACGICQIPLDFFGDRSNHMVAASVDHCHETKRVRGLLCKNCNLGIGHFKENLLFLEGAISYLKATT